MSRRLAVVRVGMALPLHHWPVEEFHNPAHPARHGVLCSASISQAGRGMLRRKSQKSLGFAGAGISRDARSEASSGRQP